MNTHVKIEKKEKKKYEIFGTVYDVERPKMRQIAEFEIKRQGCGEDSVKMYECARGFLEKLGIPEDVVDDLEPDDMNLIIEDISGAKKK